MEDYPGPLRHEPIAVELHNTRYAAAGVAQDGLGTPGSAAAWLHGLAGRLPDAGRDPDRVDPSALVALREEAVRPALLALVAGTAPLDRAVAGLNAASARAPSYLEASRQGGALTGRRTFGAATREDVVLAALAADAIDLITGARGAGLRACGAPGCVLLYLQAHPRQGWCSAGCGNRARQARHYARHRRA